MTSSWKSTPDSVVRSGAGYLKILIRSAHLGCAICDALFAKNDERGEAFIYLPAVTAFVNAGKTEGDRKYDDDEDKYMILTQAQCEGRFMICMNCVEKYSAEARR